MVSKTKRPSAATKSGWSTTAADTGETFFPTAWLMASYLVLAVLFFLPALLPGVQMFGTDYLAVAYFWEQFVTERFAAGELPKWLPHVYGGAPFYANPMDTYYPLTLVLRLLRVPTHEHLGLIFVVNFTLAGVGTHLLVSALGARRFAAYLAGLAFMFSGYLISYIYGGHDGRAIVATLAPLFLFALHRGVQTGGIRWFVLGGAVIGSAMLSFQIQSSYYLLLAGGLWFVFLAWHFEIHRSLPALARRIGGGVLLLAIGFSMAAVNFLPFLSYIDASPRAGSGGRGYEYATSWAMPPVEIVGLAVPERIGMLGQYWGQNGMKAHTEYAGALTLLLVALGIYLLRRNRYGWFFLGLGALTLTFAFGGHTPIYRLYYEFLPGTAKFRAPSISLFLLTLSMTVTAGLALERLAMLRDAASSPRQDEDRRLAEATLSTVTRVGLGLIGATLLWGLAVAVGSPEIPTGTPTTLQGYRALQAALNHPDYVQGVWRFAFFLVITAGALWLWLRGSVSTRVAGLLLVAVTVTDLWVIDKKFFETVPEPSRHFAADEVTTFLRAQPGPFRTMMLFDMPQDDYLTYFGLELIGGEHGNQLHSYNEFLGAGERTYTDFHNMTDPNFLALANAKYLVTTQSIEASFLEPVFQGRVRDGRTATVYENRIALPRAFVVPVATRVEDRDAVLDRMRSADFDPGQEVLLYEPPPLASGETAVRGGARIIRHDPAEVVVEVAADAPAYLVLTDNYYPDWRVEIDGQPAPLYRAYHTFRAVPFPAGEHTVTFRFEPRSLQIGFRISLAVWLGLLAYGGLLGFGAWRSRTIAVQEG